jgi:ribosomal protein L37AE/L43A
MRIECKAQDLHDAIDAAWERERQEPTCPECDGNAQLSEDGTICWSCQASDYLGEEEAR